MICVMGLSRKRAALLVGCALTCYLLRDIRLRFFPPSGKPCLPDIEGHWSIGMFSGNTPFNLTPIEEWVPRADDSNSMAWPVANPVLTCASVIGRPSNYVAQPMLIVDSNTEKRNDFQNKSRIHMFFQTKSNDDGRGAIAVAESVNGGITWNFIGIALSESWSLSHPYVFKYEKDVYMIADGENLKSVTLYKSVGYPLKWQVFTTLVDSPLRKVSVLEWHGSWYMFGIKNNLVFGQKLEIFKSDSPLGPWTRILSTSSSDEINSSLFASRVFEYNGDLYRYGAQNGRTFEVKAYKIESLSPNNISESMFQVVFNSTRQMERKTWDSVRHQRLDTVQLPDGSWIASMDGDWKNVYSFFGVSWIQVAYVFLFWALFTFLHSVQSNALMQLEKKKWQYLWRTWQSKTSRAAVRFGCRHGVRFKVSPYAVYLTVIMGVIAFVPLIFGALYYISVAPNGSSVAEASNIEHTYSSYTIVMLSHKDRMGTLRPMVKHYSYCPSVKEIVVVWSNKKENADAILLPEDLPAACPVRVRNEHENSLNMRFKPDPLIRTRAVLSIDDDILMRCSDIEKGFSEWRRSPLSIVGFHPRLLIQTPSKKVNYLSEGETIRKKIFNVALTNAAFLDADTYFPAYWSNEVAEARAIVNKHFNGEDILMNFVVGDHHRKFNIISDPVKHVRPRRRIDISWKTPVGISRGSQHKHIRQRCTEEFRKLFGGFMLKDVELSDGSKEGVLVMCLPFTGCIYL